MLGLVLLQRIGCDVVMYPCSPNYGLALSRRASRGLSPRELQIHRTRHWPAHSLAGSKPHKRGQ